MPVLSACSCCESKFFHADTMTDLPSCCSGSVTESLGEGAPVPLVVEILEEPVEVVAEPRAFLRCKIGHRIVKGQAVGQRVDPS